MLRINVSYDVILSHLLFLRLFAQPLLCHHAILKYVIVKRLQFACNICYMFLSLLQGLSIRIDESEQNMKEN